MDDHIIRFGDCGRWHMTVDLKELADSAGIRKKMAGYDEKLASVPLSRAKKLLRLIRQYGMENDWAACDKYLARNARLYKYWRELCRI